MFRDLCDAAEALDWPGEEWIQTYFADDDSDWIVPQEMLDFIYMETAGKKFLCRVVRYSMGLPYIPRPALPPTPTPSPLTHSHQYWEDYLIAAADTCHELERWGWPANNARRLVFKGTKDLGYEQLSDLLEMPPNMQETFCRTLQYLLGRPYDDAEK